MTTSPANKRYRIISNNHELDEMCRIISTREWLSIDTEYDSFQRQYGFKLLLLQVYDGETTYLVDPLSIRDTGKLWRVFEQENICKILYAASEDIALMKQWGCKIKNVFDVQIAATLCNHEARNLRDLIEQECAVVLDKKEQKSDWSIRPLTAEQIEYAINDVIHLPYLKNKLTDPVRLRGLYDVLEEENLALEQIPEREHIPAIKPIYYQIKSKSYCDSLQRLLDIRDQIARELNLPPVRVVDTRYLEEALDRKDEFLQSENFTGFNPRIRNSGRMKTAFIEAIEAFDPTDETRYPRVRNINPNALSKQEKIELTEKKFNPFKHKITEQYGERTAEYLLRNLRKVLLGETAPDKEVRRYQMKYLEEMK